VSEMSDVALDIKAACKLPLCSMPAAAGATRFTFTARSRWPRPLVSRGSKSKTNSCPAGRASRRHRPSGAYRVLRQETQGGTGGAHRSNLVIIARTNARRAGSIEEAIRRGEAFAKAGADMVFSFTRNPEEVRMVGERVPPPLMTFAPVDGFAASRLSRADYAKLGFRLAASSGTAFAAMYKAVKQSYECLAQDRPDPFLGQAAATP